MTLEIENSVLVIVDVQGKLARMVQQDLQVINAVTKLVKAANLFDIPLLWLEQMPDKLGATVDEIQLAINQHFPASQPIIKHTFNALANEQFAASLQDLNRDQVIIAGIESHICVYQTAVAMLAQSYQVYAVTDAISSTTAENSSLGLSEMQRRGATLTSVEMALFELQQTAQGVRFKAMLKIIT